MVLPQLVKSGSPIRAADQNMLIGAVRALANRTVAKGGAMQHTRVLKHQSFRTTVGFDSVSGQAVVMVDGGTYFDSATPSGIIGETAWHVPKKEDNKPWVWEHKTNTSESGYVVLKKEGDNEPVLAWMKTITSNDDDIACVVAKVELVISDGKLGSAVVLQVLHGDYFKGGGGKTPTRHMGHPFAWTRVDKDQWVLGALAVVCRRVFFAVNKSREDSGLLSLDCGVYMPVVPRVDESFSSTSHRGWHREYNAGTEGEFVTVVPGITVWAASSQTSSSESESGFSGRATLIVARIDVSSARSVSVTWGTMDLSSLVKDSDDWPHAPSRFVARLNVGLKSVPDAYHPKVTVGASYAVDDDNEGAYTTTIPMAVLAPTGEYDFDIVPIHQGVVEVFPSIAFGLTAIPVSQTEVSDVFPPDCAGSVSMGLKYCISGPTTCGIEPYDADLADIA